jgi:hypothetical protein
MLLASLGATQLRKLGVEHSDGLSGGFQCGDHGVRQCVAARGSEALVPGIGATAARTNAAERVGTLIKQNGKWRNGLAHSTTIDPVIAPQSKTNLAGGWQKGSRKKRIVLFTS